ncbi:hypothetical protein DIPPA_53380, partial [Diplonema papillatum]
MNAKKIDPQSVSERVGSYRLAILACLWFTGGYVLAGVSLPSQPAVGTPQPPAKPEAPKVFYLTTPSSSLRNHSLYRDLPGGLLNWDFYNKTLLFKNASVQVPREEVRQLVSGRNFLFIGDSVMRYHYLLFLRIIEEKEFLDNDLVNVRVNKFINGSRPLPEFGGLDNPNIASQVEWKDWPHYLGGTTKIFDQMCCECRRDATTKTWAQQKENRFYYNKERDVRASFYFTHGDSSG